MSNTATVLVSLQVDEKGVVRGFQDISKESTNTGRKGKKAFDDMDKGAKGFNESAKMSASTLLKMGAGVAGIVGLTKAWSSLKAAGAEYLELAGEQEAAETRLAAVLKATGEASGYNIEQLKAMASGFQEVTRTGDETTLGGMAVLATFKQVRGEGFERATMAALDMSTVMKQDLNSAILQIGKALNDPAQGMSALSRAGVTFTEGQKETIKTLQDSGQVMEAQNIILKELESQFGGAAEAAAKTFHGALEQATNALGDTKEEMGFVITKNQFFIELLQIGKETFIEWGNETKSNRENLMQLAKDGIMSVVTGLEIAIETLRFFHNGWLGIQLVGQVAVQALATALDKLYPIIRTSLKPLDALFEGMVKIGALDSNPFDSLESGLSTFKDSSAEVTRQIMTEIEGVNSRYDGWKSSIGALKDKLGEIPAAVVDIASEESKSHNARMGQLTDQGDGYEAMTDKQIKALNEFSDAHSKATKTDFEYELEQLDKKYDHYDKHVKDKLALEEWYSAELKRLQADRLKSVDSALDAFFGDIDDSWKGLTETQKRELEKQQRAHESLFETIQGKISDIVSDWSGAWDTVKSIGKQAAAELVSTFATQKLVMPVVLSAGSAMGLSWQGTSFEDIAKVGGYGTESGGLGSGGILQGAATMYGAVTGGISAAAFDVAYGALTPALETFGASAATASAAASSIASTMATIAPYLAIAAVAIPVIADLFSNDPTPAIGLSFGENRHADESGIISSLEGYNYYSWVQDIGGREETGQAIITYFDGLFAAIDEATEFSVKEALQNVSYDRHVELDLFDGDVEAAMAELTSRVFDSVREGLVSAVVSSEISGSFDNDFFGKIQSERGYETLFEAYAEFAVMVESMDDFSGRFAEQVEDYGKTSYDAYNNLVTISTTLEQVRSGLASITSVSSISTLQDLTDNWYALIAALEEANATTAEVAEAKSAMAQVLGANITGLTADALQTALSQSGDLSTVLDASITGAAYAYIAQTISDSYLSAINDTIGQVWIDTGGDIQAVIAAMREIDTTEAQAQILELQEAFGLMASQADSLAEANRIVSMSVNGQLNAAEQFEAWAINNADAVTLFQRLLENDVTKAELEGSVDAFSALGIEGKDLTNIITELAARFVDAANDLKDSISDVQSAQDLLAGGGQGAGSAGLADQLAAIWQGFVDFRSWDEIYGSQTSTTEVFDESAFKTAFLDYVTWSDFFDADAYDYNKITAWNAEVGGGITQDDWIKALADAGLTRREHYEQYGVHEGIRPWYSYDYFDSIEEYFKQYASSLPRFLSTVNEASFYTTETETIPGEISSSEQAISDAMAIISSLEPIVSNGVVDTAALDAFATALSQIDPAVLRDLYGATAADMLTQLAETRDDYYDSSSGSSDDNSSSGTWADDSADQRYQTQEQSLNIELLKAQGKEAEALQLQRQAALEQLRADYGDEADALAAIQEQIWELEDAADALGKAESNRLQAADDYLTALKEEQALLEDELATAKATYISLLQEELSTQKATASALERAISSLKDWQNNLMTGDDSPLSLETQKASLSTRLDELVAAANAGDTDAMADLPGVATSLIDVTRQLSTDWREIEWVTITTAAALAGVEKSAKDQLSEAERQIRKTQDLIDEVNGIEDKIIDLDAARTAYEAKKSAVDTSWYQDEIDVLQGILDSNRSLEELMAAWNSSQTDYSSAGGAAPTDTSTAASSTTILDQERMTVIDAILANSQLQPDGTYNLAGTPGIAWNQLVNTVYDNPDYYGPKLGFADGGIATGPLSGYDVELHGTEAIIPLKAGAVPVHLYAPADSYGPDLISEFRGMRQDMDSFFSSLESNGAIFARFIDAIRTVVERWDRDGLPGPRDEELEDAA